MDWDWKKVVQTVAPVIGTALGGPLVGAAVAEVGKAVLGKDNASLDEVQAAIESGGLTQDALLKLKELDVQFKGRMAELGLDMEKLKVEQDKAYLADRADARKAGAGKDNIFYLGLAILGTFGVIMGLVLYGCFSLLTGGITIKDVAVVAAVFGLLGSVLGYVGANAQQVVGFYYGTSLGSSQKTAALVEAVSRVGSAVAG